MLHFGEADSHIGTEQVEAVRTAHPEVEVHTYAGAGHGFANPYRAEYDETQEKVAWGRTGRFLEGACRVAGSWPRLHGRREVGSRRLEPDAWFRTIRSASVCGFVVFRSRLG